VHSSVQYCLHSTAVCRAVLGRTAQHCIDYANYVVGKKQFYGSGLRDCLMVIQQLSAAQLSVVAAHLCNSVYDCCAIGHWHQ